MTSTISPLFLRALLDSLPKPDQVNDLSLGTGLTGFALASCRASIALDDLEVAGRSQAYFQRIEQLINHLPTLPPSLWGGVAGIAWVYRLCSKRLELPDMNGFGEKIIELLLEYVDGKSCTDNIDIISGLAGIGLFAAHSSDLSGAEKLANAISEKLIAACRRDEHGIYWLSPSHYLGLGDRDVFLDGARNLGLAHGIPGPLAFFTNAAQSWPHISLYSETADSIGKWLLRQQENDQYGAFWSSLSERRGQYCRFAWCYGDLGVALAIGQWGRIRKSLDLGSMAARVIIQNFRQRPVSDLYIEDAGLCHGWGGVVAFSQLMCVPLSENDTIYQLKKIADEGLAVLLNSSLPSLPSPAFLGGRAGLLTLLSDRYANNNPSGWEALFGAMLPAPIGIEE